MTKKKQDEPKYSRAEIMAAASSFGVRPETMAGALRLAGKDELIRSEVLEAIKKFKEVEV